MNLEMPTRSIERISTDRNFLNRALTRRAVGGLLVGSIMLGSLFQTLEVAQAAVLAGNYQIVRLDFTSGLGKQSFPWMPAREDVSREFDPIDQADVANSGGNSYFAAHGSVGDLYQSIATKYMNRIPNGRVWAGNCFPAAVASGNCPEITGPIDSPAPGLPGMTFRGRMFLADLYHRNMLRERIWTPPWTNASFQEIKDTHNRTLDFGIRKYLVANTATFRGNPADQEWNNYIRGFDGGIVISTDFIESYQLDRPRLKSMDVPFNAINSITLVDPSQPDPEPGPTSQYYNLFPRDIAELYLGMAVVVQ